ncbi:bromodomain domain protein [Gregarina niphandrodes]|uniref:Bromodomain domain protein n=1 Tax=Gregarina niphandrodes TaxID=110365 RepID=A0A023B8I7_GRENI|nr:bromodomain domain protein [Gregarina niphandrodes]EZG68931.1 bromodomain domain protein [Gregarina niphandrodes]|eukprot:XP_011134522.1 bromodomain domain protein [Gregarina niphandrodes]
MRKYLRHLIAAELFGKVESAMILQKTLDLYITLCDRGWERYPLACSKSLSHYSVLYPLSPVYQLKCQLLLVALECHVVSLSVGRNFLTANFFKNFIFGYVKKYKSKDVTVHLDKFFERLKIRVLSEFIRLRLHKSTEAPSGNQPPPATAEEPVVNVRELDDNLVPEQLQLHPYRGHPTLDVEEFVSDLEGFERAYVGGVGCGLVIVALWYELQRKTGQLEVVKLRLDEHALSAPKLIDNNMFSYYFPAVGAVPAIITALLNGPQWMNLGPSDEGDARSEVRKALLQSSNVSQFLDQLGFDVAAMRGNPVELIVKDNKLAVGYGYVGNAPLPLYGGRGTLFTSLHKQATASWAALTPEQRAAMASDSSNMEQLVASTPTAHRVQVAALGGAVAEWVVNVICWHALKQCVTLSEFVPKVKYHKTPVSKDHAVCNVWLDSLKKESLRADLLRLPFTSKLPESGTVGCVWPAKLLMRTYEDAAVCEDVVAIKPNAHAVSFVTLRDQSVTKKTSMTLPRVLGVTVPSQRVFANGENCKLLGTAFGHEDLLLLSSACSDTVRNQFAPTTKQPTAEPAPVPTDSGDSQNARATPMLWIRPSEDSFFIGRLQRFQSLAMWMNQLARDTCVRAQLEAAKALSALAAEHVSAFDTLVSAAFNVRLHPNVRKVCVHGIANAVGSVIANDHVEKVIVGRLLPLFQESMCPGLINNDPMPPVYSSLAFEQLRDLYTVVSQLRNNVNETPSSVWDFYIHCLSRWPFPVDVRLGTQFSCETFAPATLDETLPLHMLVAELIASLPNLTFPAPPENSALFNIRSWCDSRTHQIFLSVYTRAEMEKKLPTGDREVTKAYLAALSRIPAFQILARCKALERSVPLDPLFSYLPVSRPVPASLAAELPLPDLATDKNSWLYLRRYRDRALHHVDPMSQWGVAIQHVSQQICNSLNYSDFTVQAKAMHCTLSLILQGRLIPPLWVMDFPTHTPLALTHLIVEHTPLGCIWIDNPVTQEAVRRLGLGVLHCVRLLTALEILLPFSNDAGLLVASWAAFLECLQHAARDCPLSLLPWVLDTGHLPVATAVAATKEKKKKKPHATNRHPQDRHPHDRHPQDRHPKEFSPDPMGGPDVGDEMLRREVIVPEFQPHGQPSEDYTHQNHLATDGSLDNPSGVLAEASAASPADDLANQGAGFDESFDQFDEFGGGFPGPGYPEAGYPAADYPAADYPAGDYPEGGFPETTQLDPTTTSMDDMLMQELGDAVTGQEWETDLMEKEFDEIGEHFSAPPDQLNTGTELDGIDDLGLPTDFGDDLGLPDDLGMLDDLGVSEGMRVDDVYMQDGMVLDLDQELVAAGFDDGFLADQPNPVRQRGVEDPPETNLDGMDQDGMDNDGTGQAGPRRDTDREGADQGVFGGDVAGGFGDGGGRSGRLMPGSTYRSSPYNGAEGSVLIPGSIPGPSPGSVPGSVPGSIPGSGSPLHSIPMPPDMVGEDHLDGPAAEGHKTSKRKRKTKNAIPKDIPMIVPVTVEVYEILYKYLHAVVPSLCAIADRLVYYVREVVYFLYGMGVSPALKTCSEDVGANMQHFSATGQQEELVKLQKFILANYYCLSPATTANAASCSKQVSRLARQGLPVRAISSYDRVEITAWAYSKFQKQWPLPVQIDWKTLAKRMVSCLIEHPSGHWFVHPVNAKANPNYYKIIDSPMWLLKAAQKLKNNEYSSFDEWRNDIFTIFRNCRTYNAPMTLILLDCDILQSLSYQLLHFATRLLTSS